MITDTKINKIQAKINRAIAAIAKEENVTIAFGSISFNSAYYTTSMKVTTLEKNEKVSLTIGREYDILDTNYISPNEYMIMNDYGFEHLYPVKCFVTKQELREEKLNELGI